MPWQPEPFNKVIQEAKDQINKYFNVKPGLEVYICTGEEMSKAVLEEFEHKKMNDQTVEHIKRYYLKKIIGKYFDKKNEIWLVEGKGDNIEVLVHELLHAIQKCRPNREKIVDYVTYNITGLSTQIPYETMVEWKEIEKTYGLKTILNQLLLEKDCEDFD